MKTDQTKVNSDVLLNYPNRIEEILKESNRLQRLQLDALQRIQQALFRPSGVDSAAPPAAAAVDTQKAEEAPEKLPLDELTMSVLLGHCRRLFGMLRGGGEIRRAIFLQGTEVDLNEIANMIRKIKMRDHPIDVQFDTIDL